MQATSEADTRSAGGRAGGQRRNAGELGWTGQDWTGPPLPEASTAPPAGGPASSRGMAACGRAGQDGARRGGGGGAPGDRWAQPPGDRP